MAYVVCLKVVNTLLFAFFVSLKGRVHSKKVWLLFRCGFRGAHWQSRHIKVADTAESYGGSPAAGEARQSVEQLLGGTNNGRILRAVTRLHGYRSQSPQVRPVFLLAAFLTNLIKSNAKVGFERPAIYRVHVVCSAFVYSGVHLCGGIYFQFAFYFILSYLPFVDLKAVVMVRGCMWCFFCEYLHWGTNERIFPNHLCTKWCAVLVCLSQRTRRRFCAPTRIHSQNGTLELF